MSRLRSADYLTNRSDLLADWLKKIPVISHLTPADQHLLHNYFAFTKQLNEKEALAYRKSAATTDASLPQRAGKAMKRFRVAESIDWVVRDTVRVGTGARRHLSVRAVMRPEPDLDTIAGTVLSLAIDLAKTEDDDAA